MNAKKGKPAFVALAALAGVLVVQPAAAQGWKAEWDKLVAAAKKEGEIVVSGPIGAPWKKALTTFEQDFGIKVRYSGQWGRDFYPRLIQERKVGKYLWDLRLTAAGAVVYKLKREGKTVRPVRDMLFRPDVTGDKYWHGGFNSIFADNDRKYFLGFGLNSLPVAWVNRDVVPASQVKTLQDLLKPELAGKISIQNMRAGAALVQLGSVMSHKDYGPDYIRKLINGQKAVVIKNSRQQIEWLVRGKYPVAMAITSGILLSFKKRGLAKNVVRVQGLPKFSSGFGGLIAMQNAPHPNAAKLYANWVLTRDVQTRIAKTASYNSRRTDVPVGNKLTTVDTGRLGDYSNAQTEDMLPYYRKVIGLARELGQ